MFFEAKSSQDAILLITIADCQKSMLSLPQTANIACIKYLLCAMYVFAVSAFLRVGETTKTGMLNQHYLLVKSKY